MIQFCANMFSLKKLKSNKFYHNLNDEPSSKGWVFLCLKIIQDLQFDAPDFSVSLSSPPYFDLFASPDITVDQPFYTVLQSWLMHRHHNKLRQPKSSIPLL